MISFYKDYQKFKEEMKVKLPSVGEKVDDIETHILDIKRKIGVIPDLKDKIESLKLTLKG